MLAVVRRRTMLRRSGCLRSHLKLANLTCGKATIVAVARALLLGLLLLLLLWRLGLLLLRLVETGRFGVRAREVDADGGGRDLALDLDQTRLKVDDVVSELVVLRLQRLVELAQLLKLLDLVLELLDVLLFALAEGTL